MTAPKVPKTNAARTRILTLEQAQRDTRTKALANAVNRWLVKYGRLAAKDVKVGSIQKTKAKDKARLISELESILARFGLQQVDDAGGRWAATLGGEWILQPRAKLDYTKQIKNKVKLIVKETEAAVRDSIQRTIQEAFKEKKRPTTREIARRIATRFHGPPDGREAVFSPGRALRIAQTEIGDADTAGALEGFAESGVKKVAWLARPNDGKSGDRQHYKMNRHKALTVEDIRSSDRSRWFRLPSGARCRRPLDPMLPVGERVNCRCVLIPRS